MNIFKRKLLQEENEEKVRTISSAMYDRLLSLPQFISIHEAYGSLLNVLNTSLVTINDPSSLRLITAGHSFLMSDDSLEKFITAMEAQARSLEPQDEKHD
jgi:hypothetical protein